MSFSNSRSYNPQTWAQREDGKRKRTPLAAAPTPSSTTSVPPASTRASTASPTRSARSSMVPTPPFTERSATTSAKPSRSTAFSASRVLSTPAGSSRRASPTRQPTHPNTSAKRLQPSSERTATRQNKQRTSTSATPRRAQQDIPPQSKTPSQRRSCNVCGTELEKKQRHRCQTCPELYFCEDCILNAAVLHPQHVFVRQSDANEAEVDPPVQKITTPPRQYQCTFCPNTMVDIRFECLDCPTILCPQHSTFHTKGHRILQVVSNHGAKKSDKSGDKTGLESIDETFMSIEVQDDRVLEGSDGHSIRDGQGDVDEGVMEVDTEHSGGTGRELEDDDDDDDDDDDSSYDIEGEKGKDIGVDTEDMDEYIGDEDQINEDQINEDQIDDDLIDDDLIGDGAALLETTISITLRHQKPIRDEETLKRRIHAALGNIIEGSMTSKDQSSGPSPRRSSGSVLDFDIDLACQDSRIRRHRGGHAPRFWTEKDRRELERMMSRGWAAEDVAAKLKRSTSAVQQQWRKQKTREVSPVGMPRPPRLGSAIHITTSPMRHPTARRGSQSRAPIMAPRIARSRTRKGSHS